MRTDFGDLLHKESVNMDHELRWNLLVLELLKYDTDDHEILDVVWSNDEACRWYFLHLALMALTGDVCGIVS